MDFIEFEKQVDNLVFITERTMAMLPGDDDDSEGESGDWSDIDDEDFEDMAEDKDDYHQIQVDNDLFDPEDDDHLPDDDD